MRSRGLRLLLSVLVAIACCLSQSTAQPMLDEGGGGGTPVLNISKADAPDPVAAGSTITYTISYSNTGYGNATEVTIADAVPTNTTFVSASGTGTLAGGVVTWAIGPLAAGASGTETLTVQVNSPLPNGTVITNGTYSIDSTETTPTSGAAVTTTVTSAPVLNISKTDAPDPVAAGSNITYTISYSNTGNENATGVVITDTVPVNTTFVSASGTGTLAGGVVTWTVGPLAAGASGSETLTVQVNSPLPNGTVITNGTYQIDSTQTAPTSGVAVMTTVTSACVSFIVASSSFPNVEDGPKNMSGECYDGTSGAVSRSSNSDDVWQCAQEVPRLNSGKILEHLWEFPNVPPGRLFVQFEGHKRLGLRDDGFLGEPGVEDDFIFLSNVGPAGTPCPTDLGGGEHYQLLSSGDNYATFIHDTGDSSGTLLVTQRTDFTRICIMAMSVKTCPIEPPCRFQQIDSTDTQKDLVEIDRLRICTDLCDDGVNQCP